MPCYQRTSHVYASLNSLILWLSTLFTTYAPAEHFTFFGNNSNVISATCAGRNTIQIGLSDVESRMFHPRSVMLLFGTPSDANGFRKEPCDYFLDRVQIGAELRNLFHCLASRPSPVHGT